MIRFICSALLFISVASMIGIATSSFIAVLALHGSLSNFAGGVIILGFKPFVVGDVIEAHGQLGTVHKIQIFNTILLSLDNKKVIIPNSILSNDMVTNLFVEETRRVDMKFAISYGDNMLVAKDIFMDLLATDERIV